MAQLPDWMKGAQVEAPASKAGERPVVEFEAPQEPVSPVEAARLGIALRGEERAARNEERAAAREERAANKPTEAQGRNSVLIGRIKGGWADISEVLARAPQAQMPGVAETLVGGTAAAGLSGLAAREVSGPDRRIIADSQADMLDAILTLGTGAA